MRPLPTRGSRLSEPLLLTSVINGSKPNPYSLPKPKLLLTRTRRGAFAGSYY